MAKELNLKSESDIKITEVETQTIPAAELEKAKAKGSAHSDPFFIIE
jgi:hypothetical protein